MTDSLLRTLDREVELSANYFATHEANIEQLKANFHSNMSATEEYEFNTRIIELYNKYQSDSLLHYLNRNIELARRLGDIARLNQACIKRCQAYSTLGIFHVALDLLEQIDPKSIDEEDRNAYHDMAANIYRTLSSESRDTAYIHLYKHLYSLHRDSLLQRVPADSETYLHYMQQMLEDSGEHEKAIEINTHLIGICHPQSESYATYAFDRANTCRTLGRNEEALQWFIRSALADIRRCIRENAAMANVARCLASADDATPNDLTRGYRYIHKALDDAQEYNTPYRKTQIMPATAAIDGRYHMHMQQQRMKLTWALIITVVGVLIIGGLSMSLYKSLKRGRNLNRKLADAYRKELAIKESLKEANVIKEECINNFLWLSAKNIDKLETYRQTVYKKLTNKQYTELLNIARDTHFMRQEADEFYKSFDTAIMRIFPGFVDEFNNLLRPDAKIMPKRDGELTPELRIFALIRLGVSNSADIARLLRYSISTIYNYRVKVRKLSREGITPDDFEEQVKHIGISSVK